MPRRRFLAQAGKARRAGALLQQDDGPPWALQQGGFRIRQDAELPHRVEIAAEDGQRLFGPVLALPQTEDGCLIPGVAGQVDAAGAFDRHRRPAARACWARAMGSPGIARPSWSR